VGRMQRFIVKKVIYIYIYIGALNLKKNSCNHRIHNSKIFNFFHSIVFDFIMPCLPLFVSFLNSVFCELLLS
jgi:hypothetical protein